MSKGPRVLLVDDEPGVLRALQRQLIAVDRGSEPGYGIEAYSLPLEALARAAEETFDVVISDYRMPDMDGVVFLTRLRALQPFAARIILSGQADLKAMLGAINEAGVTSFLCKPWEYTDLVLALENALRQRALLLENRRLADEVRVQQGVISRQEAELRRLESECPGLIRIDLEEDEAR